MEIFKGDTLPEPKSLVRATAEANNLVALTTAKSLYTSKMESVSSSTLSSLISLNCFLEEVQAAVN